ncbi:hypothetical protein Pst134EB_002272 [Puccinia striiformis f. sp. tritici]|nr:hypothetical protein Pst134EB_002272 [Puccinia striiformis f. sp. tritici]
MNAYPTSTLVYEDDEELLNLIVVARPHPRIAVLIRIIQGANFAVMLMEIMRIAIMIWVLCLEWNRKLLTRLSIYQMNALPFCLQYLVIYNNIIIKLVWVESTDQQTANPLLKLERVSLPRFIQNQRSSRVKTAKNNPGLITSTDIHLNYTPSFHLPIPARLASLFRFLTLPARFTRKVDSSAESLGRQSGEFLLEREVLLLIGRSLDSFHRGPLSFIPMLLDEAVNPTSCGLSLSLSTKNRLF